MSRTFAQGGALTCVANREIRDMRSKRSSDPWIAQVMFGLVLTVFVVSEVAMFSGLATIPKNWP